MKIADLLQELKSYPHAPIDESKTVDTVKLGDPLQELRGVGICMLATPRVIRQAMDAGCNLLIVHEPLYYNHRDSAMPYPICHTKKALLEQSGMTVFRYHDYPHRLFPDLITEGELLAADLQGHYDAEANRFFLDRPMSTLELARTLEKKLQLKHLRIAGSRTNQVRSIACCFGATGSVCHEAESCDTVLTGEICEWSEGEYFRDLAEFGEEKSIIVMGHFNSEKCGMMLLAERLRKSHPALSVAYFDSGDLYSYTDQD